MAEAHEEAAIIMLEQVGVLGFSRSPIAPPMINEQPRVVASHLARYKWWLRIAVFTFFVLSGQSTATLLGRLYFEQGGSRKWLETIVIAAGFPILIPFLFICRTQKKGESHDDHDQHQHQHQHQHDSPSPNLATTVTLYILLGICLAANIILFTVGLAALPVSTFSLICASQLAFNAFFSYFLNSQKFTPYIINSLVLLTASSTLLVFQNERGGSSSSSKSSKYVIGFVCTVAGAAIAGLSYSATQLALRKYLKPATYKVVFELIIYQSAVATVVLLILFFGSGEWKSVHGDVKGYKLGSTSYVITLVGTAVSWQVFNVGCIGLIFEVSSLFSNVISALSVPIVPVLALIFFHDKMNGVKVIAMLLALWGFASYIYQTYIEDLNSRNIIHCETENVIEISLTESGSGDQK